MKTVWVRHGQSEYNAENRSTGWHDPELTELGAEQAMQTAKELAKKYNLNLLCRFNGREFEKINDIDLKKCENFMKTNKINYYICK